MLTVGQKIKKYLDEHGISQTFVAEKTGISVSKMNLILAGKRKLIVEDYDKICAALGLEPNTFCEARKSE